MGVVRLAACAAFAEDTSPVAAGRDTPVNEFAREAREPVVIAFGPAKLDRQVLPVYEAGLLQSLAECSDVEFVELRRRAVKEADDRTRLRPNAGSKCCERAGRRDEGPARSCAGAHVAEDFARASCPGRRMQAWPRHRSACSRKAGTGCRYPLRASGPSDSSVAMPSSAARARRSVRICPGPASSQSRAARFTTPPIAE